MCTRESPDGGGGAAVDTVGLIAETLYRLLLCSLGRRRERKPWGFYRLRLVLCIEK